MSQLGVLTLGPTGQTQLVLSPDGSISSASYTISGAGGVIFTTIRGTTGTFTGALEAQSTSQFTGLATFNGGITTVGATTLVQTNAKFADGAAATPSISFDNSTTTGLFRSSGDVIGVTIAGTETFTLGATGFDAPKLQVDNTLGNITPFFKVDPTTNNVLIGPATNQLSLDNTNTLKSVGTDIDIPLNFETKGGGDFIFKGGTDKEFNITDGTSNVVSVDTATGTALFSGNLDAGKLRIRQNVIQNNSSTAVRSFGEVVALTVTGTGSGYTDGTYTATPTTSTGGGTGCTVTVTVSGGDFSAVTIVDKGQNYAIGDTLLITAAGGGSGRSVTVSDIDGQGVVLKPSTGASILCDTTGSLVIPSGTTNERPNALDRVTGAIRFNSTQLQFEGYNGQDFVSLGGVRDVDQDTYVLTESSPGADEDVFEFYNTGVNSLSIAQDKITLRTAKTFETDGTLSLKGTSIGFNPLDVLRGSASIFKVRDRKDIEVTSGGRLRAVPTQGTIATIGTVTSNGNNYGASQTYTGVSGLGEFDGSGATFDVVTNGSGGITSVAVNAGGVLYEVGEIITIAGNLLGGATPADDVKFPVDSLSNTSAAKFRLDVLNQNFITRLDSKTFIDLDANGSEAGWKINRGWNGGTENYLTVFDSTATFMELDDCRVEGGQLTSFPSSATITAFNKTQFKGSKTLVTIESNDNKVHMLEVTIVCASNGTTAHATVTNSVTSDNDLVDATISVVGNDVNISLAKSTAASSSSSFTGRFTTTKVKA